MPGTSRGNAATRRGGQWLTAKTSSERLRATSGATSPVERGSAEIEARKKYGDQRYEAMVADERSVATFTVLASSAKLNIDRASEKYVLAKTSFWSCVGFAIVVATLCGVAALVWAMT